MINPFKKYSAANREKAVRLGVVGTVAAQMGVNPGTVSRTLSGVTLRANSDIVAAINAWLVLNGLPVVAVIEAGRPSVRTEVDRLRQRAG